MGPSFACSIWTILNANKETKQIVFIYRLFSCPGPSREHESKKRDKYLPMSERRKVCKTALTNTYTQHCVDTVYWRTHTHTLCMRVMMTIVQKAHFTGRTQSGRPKREIAQQHRRTINVVDKSKSYQLRRQPAVPFGPFSLCFCLFSLVNSYPILSRDIGRITREWLVTPSPFYFTSERLQAMGIIWSNPRLSLPFALRLLCMSEQWEGLAIGFFLPRVPLHWTCMHQDIT